MKKSNWVRVDPQHVIVANNKGKLLLFGEEITQIDLKNLQQEVKALKNFRVWRIMQETLKQKAVEKGLVDSLNWETTLSAKMMLHSLGILKSIVEVLDVYQQPPHKRN